MAPSDPLSSTCAFGHRVFAAVLPQVDTEGKLVGTLPIISPHILAGLATRASTGLQVITRGQVALSILGQILATVVTASNSVGHVFGAPVNCNGGIKSCSDFHLIVQFGPARAAQVPETFKAVLRVPNSKVIWAVI